MIKPSKASPLSDPARLNNVQSLDQIAGYERGER